MTLHSYNSTIFPRRTRVADETVGVRNASHVALDQVRMLDRVLARFPGRAFAAVVVAAWAASARADLPIPPAPPAPDFVGDRAALSPSDRATKKEDAYVTGLPLASFDPNFGLGFGARANVFWNGPRDAPLFAYAPYAHRLSLTLFAATKGLQFHWLD